MEEACVVRGGGEGGLLCGDWVLRMEEANEAVCGRAAAHHAHDSHRQVVSDPEEAPWQLDGHNRAERDHRRPDGVSPIRIFLEAKLEQLHRCYRHLQ